MAGPLESGSRRGRAADLLRRPLELVVIGLVLAIGAMVVVTREVRYASTSVVLFVDSPTVEQYAIATQLDVDPTSESPLARFHDPTVVGDVFARQYRSRTKREQLVADGMQGELTITTKRSVISDTPDHGPVFEMTVVADSPAAARDGAALVLADVYDELALQQAGYDPNLSVGAAILAQPELGRAVGGSRMRSTVGFTLLAALLGVVVRQIRLRFLSRRGMHSVS